VCRLCSDLPAQCSKSFTGASIVPPCGCTALAVVSQHPLQCGVVKEHCYGALRRPQVSPPFEVAEFDIMYGDGINALGCVFDVAKDLEVLEARVSAGCDVQTTVTGGCREPCSPACSSAVCSVCSAASKPKHNSQWHCQSVLVGWVW